MIDLDVATFIKTLFKCPKKVHCKMNAVFQHSSLVTICNEINLQRDLYSIIKHLNNHIQNTPMFKCWKYLPETPRRWNLLTSGSGTAQFEELPNRKQSSQFLVVSVHLIKQIINASRISESPILAFILLIWQNFIYLGLVSLCALCSELLIRPMFHHCTYSIWNIVF